MKTRLTKLLLILSLFLLVFSGCSENKTEIESDELDLYILFSVDTDLFPEDRIFHTNEDQIVLPLNIETGPDNIDLGIMIFVDGIIQPFTFNGSNESYMHRFSSPSVTTINNEIAFRPSFANVQPMSKLNIIFVEMQSLDTIDPNALYKIVHYDLATYYLNPIYENAQPSLQSNINSNYEKLPLPDTLFDNTTIENSDDALPDFNLYEVYSNDKTYFITAENNVASLTFSAMGGYENHLYRATLFINHEPVELNGSLYFDFYGSPAEQYIYQFNIDTQNLQEENLVYFMVTDISNEDEFNKDIFKSRNALLYK